MKIERLTLHTGPLTDGEAHELAQQVAQALAGMPLQPAAALRIDVAQPSSGSVDTLRDAVVSAVEAALAGGVETTAGSGGRDDHGGGRP